MGLFDSFLTPNTTSVPTSSTSTTALPDYVSQGGKNLFNAALTVANQEYPTYTGPRVASLSDPQQSGIDFATGAAGNPSAYGDAMEGALAGVDRWDAGYASQYMNPFVTGALSVADREMTRRHEMDDMGRAAEAVNAGAFGGARHGVIDAEADRSLALSREDLYRRGMAGAYDRAFNAFQADQGRKLQGGQVASGLADSTINRLMQAGGVEQQQEQRNLDTAYADFIEQRQWPYENINFAMGALSGVPYNTTTTQQGQQVIQAPSTMGQLGGAALALSSFF